MLSIKYRREQVTEHYLKIFKHDTWRQELGHFEFTGEETFHEWGEHQNDALSSLKFHIPPGWELWIHKHRSPISRYQSWRGNGAEIHIDKQDIEHFIHDEASGHSWVKSKGIQDNFEQIKENKAGPFIIENNAGLEFPKRSGKKHQQAIQKMQDGGFVITGSADGTGYFYLTDPALKVINVIEPKYKDKDYDHLGGGQVTENILAVGYEGLSGGAKGTSAVLFYDISDVGSPSHLTHLTIDREKEFSTAGAVALAKQSDHWLLVVANWNAARLDFYKSSGLDLSQDDTHFGTPFCSWKAANNDGPGWGGYQNINLFCGHGSDLQTPDLWMVGMHTKSYICNEDWADLYQIHISGNDASLVKKRSKHFIRSAKGPRFRHGSGFFYDPDTKEFEVYSCERNIDHTSGHNRCNKWQ